MTQLNFTATSLLHREEVTIQCDYDDGFVSKVITNYSIQVEDCINVTVTLSTNEANEASSTKDVMNENIMTNDTTNIHGDLYILKKNVNMAHCSFYVLQIVSHL